MITTTTAPAVTVASLTLSPASVVGGNTSIATVTLSPAAPCSGTEVVPSSNSPAAVVPGIVTVAAGATSASFNVTTRSVTSTTAANVSIFYAGTVAKSATLIITPPGGGSAGDLTQTAYGTINSSCSEALLSLAAPNPGSGDTTIRSDDDAEAGAMETEALARD